LPTVKIYELTTADREEIKYITFGIFASFGVGTKFQSLAKAPGTALR